MPGMTGLQRQQAGHSPPPEPAEARQAHASTADDGPADEPQLGRQSAHEPMRQPEGPSDGEQGWKEAGGDAAASSSADGKAQGVWSELRDQYNMYSGTVEAGQAAASPLYSFSNSSSTPQVRPAASLHMLG